MGIRDSRTTHPQKRARRQRALERFSVNEARAARDPAYAERKAIELRSLQGMQQ
jgi:hypothetical protein